MTSKQPFVCAVSVFGESRKGEELRVIVKAVAPFPHVDAAGKPVAKAVIESMREATGFAGIVHGLLTAQVDGKPAFQIANDIPDNATCVLWVDLDNFEAPEIAHGAGLSGTDPYRWQHTNYSLDGMCRWFGVDMPRELVTKAAKAKAGAASAPAPKPKAEQAERPAPTNAKAAVDAAAAMLKALAGRDAEKAAKAPGPVTVTKPAAKAEAKPKPAAKPKGKPEARAAA